MLTEIDATLQKDLIDFYQETRIRKESAVRKGACCRYFEKAD